MKIDIKEQNVRAVLGPDGKYTGDYERVPESARSNVGPTTQQRNIGDAEKRMQTLDSELKAAGRSLADPKTWTAEDRQKIIEEAGIQAELRGLQNINSNTLQAWADSVAILELAKDSAENLTEKDVGPLDNFANELFKYTTLTDESERQAKGVQLAGVLLATGRNSRTSKYLIDKVIEIAGASGNQSAVSTLAGLNRLMTAQQGQNSAVELTLGQNPALAPLVRENKEGFAAVINLLDERIRGINGSGEQPTTTVPNSGSPY